MTETTNDNDYHVYYEGRALDAMTAAELEALLDIPEKDMSEALRSEIRRQWIATSWPLYGLLVEAGLKDPLLNMEFRIFLFEWAAKSPENKKVVKIMCKRDLLFWIAVAGIGFEPRPPLDETGNESEKRFAFITRPKQDEVLTKMAQKLGREDMYIEKSRDEGATWIIIYLFAWRVQYYRDETFLMISRREEDVYKKGAPKALFTKLEYLLTNQPKWLAPLHVMKKLICEFPETGGVINGESTNEFAGSGDRVKAALLDELAKVKYEDANSIWQSTTAMTYCRIANSTHLDANTKFFELGNTIKTKFKMGWWDNPAKAKGLYKTPEGKLRSPWYDAECERLGNDTAIKQELDINPVGSDSVFFEDFRISPIRMKTARPPTHRGKLDYSLPDFKFRQFVEDSAGALSVWCTLDKDGRPPKGITLNCGVDASTGSGASNSSMNFKNAANGETLLSFTSAKRSAYELAEDFMAIRNWWCQDESSEPRAPQPLCAWEVPGPGVQFGFKIQEFGFRNIWYRPTEELSLYKKPSLKAGFVSNGATKKTLLTEFRYALQNGQCVEHDDEVFRECLFFKYISDTVEHSGQRFGDDSGARTNHGDRVIGAAISWWITKGGIVAPVAEKPKEIENCLKARMEKKKREEAFVGGW